MISSGTVPTVRRVNESLAVDAEGISKSFGSVRAVVDVSLQVVPGVVYGVLGPNGAGA